MSNVDHISNVGKSNIKMLLELQEQAKQARSRLELEYERKPRKAKVIDRYCHTWSWTHYGIVLADDCIECGYPEGWIAPAIKQLRKDLTKIERCLQYLINN